MEGNKLDVVWRVWIGVWAVTVILSAVTGINPFVPTAWIWGLRAFAEFLVATPSKHMDHICALSCESVP
jgi:hypothetical protein